MRKVIASFVIVMLFSMFSSTVFAGKYPECDIFKGEKRLYGLCGAYQNAFNNQDQEAMADLWANWNKWATDETPDLPNAPGAGAKAVEWVTACPCWAGLTVDEICDMGNPDFLPFDSGGGFLFLENFIVEPQTVDQFFASGSMCEHSGWVQGSDPVTTTIGGLEPGPSAQCMAEVEVMAASDFCAL